MSANTARNELQKAIGIVLAADSTLTATVGTGIYDWASVPVNAPFPYITVGDGQEMAMDTFDINGYTEKINLHIWSQVGGMEELNTIVDSLRRLLHRKTQTDIPLATLSLITLLAGQLTTMLDPDGFTQHGIQQCTAFIQ